MTQTKAKELTHEDPEFLAVQYDMTAAAIIKLEKAYDPKTIPEATEKGDDGYLIIHDKTMSITKVRTSIDRVRKILKADSLAWGKKVDTEAKRLTTIVESLEAPWRKVKTDLDEKETREADEARATEQARLVEIEERIAEIKASAAGLLNADSATIQSRLHKVEDLPITDALYGDYVEAALMAKSTMIATISITLNERQEFETKQSELAQQEAELAAGQLEMKKQQNELIEKKVAQEATEAVERGRIERQEREALEAEEADQLEKDLEARLPEDLKLRSYTDTLMSVMPPELENPYMKKILAEVSERLASITMFVVANTQSQQTGG